LGIARLLTELNYSVRVWIVRGSAPETNDFRVNLDRLPKRVKVVELNVGSDQANFSPCKLLIDAIFGSGLSRPTEGIYEKVIADFNRADAYKLAVDIPSGLMADSPSVGEIARVHETLTFQIPKLAFFLPDSEPFVGDWHVLDIGLSKNFLKEVVTTNYFLRQSSVKELLVKRRKFSHKGNYGKALLIAGSIGKMGASILAARAALRSGVGLLTLHVPAQGYTIIQTAVPESMATIDPNSEYVSQAPDVSGFDVLGVGPGLGQALPTVKMLRQILESGKPMVLDADALNIIAHHRELFPIIPANSILTPHPKEFERLVGSGNSGFDQLSKQIQLARQLDSVVLVKGAHTAIALPDGTIYFNTTGNPGMATGGSGDVLTGILTALLGQGYRAPEAAILGVFVHGLAGDKAAREKGQNSLIASDLVDFLAAAFRRLT
jgi:NAD(P)H-hydrate epimerase